MKKSLLLLLPLAICGGLRAHAQTPFPTIEYIDVNNIKAAALVQGDMWRNPTAQTDACEFPQGSGLNIMGPAALWMGGYDAGHTLHVAAATYRQNGNDYWPGPLDENDTSNYAMSQQWAKIWKINYSDIETFLATATHTATNTPASILTWPGAGNTYATGSNGGSLPMVPSRAYAPFVDVNNDGIYEPLQGDYPQMTGDQMLWWMYNDNTEPHGESLTPAIKAEIQVTAYAYHRNTLIDNVIYYQYDIINWGAALDSFRIGQFADPDLGGAFNDFVGYDSTFRMGFVYNGTTNDSLPIYTGDTAHKYGTQIPMAGITMLKLPGDNGTNLVKIKSFLSYNNDFTNIGNPNNGAQYYEYLRGENLSGEPNTQVYYLTDPFAECDSSHLPGDRRFVMATDDMTFLPGEVETIVMALVTTNRDTGHACPGATLTDLTNVADTAWSIYNNPLPQAVQYVNAIQSNLTVYPNPADNILQVKYANLQNGYLVIMDVAGRTIISTQLNGSAGTQQVDIHNAAQGMYLYRVTDGGAIKAQGKITKL